MNARSFLKEKGLFIGEPNDQQEVILEKHLFDLMEEFAWKYFTDTDLRLLLRRHPHQQHVRTAVLHFLGDEAQALLDPCHIDRTVPPLPETE